MKNRLILSCSILAFTEMNAQQLDSVHTDFNLVFIDSTYFASGDSLLLANADSAATPDSVATYVSGFPCDSIDGCDPTLPCISDVVTLIPTQFSWWSGPCPWYPICGSGPCAITYTLTVVDAPACIWIFEVPKPYQRDIDLFNPPTHRVNPDHLLVTFNPDNFTPVPEKKEKVPASVPFEPDLRWISVVYPTPFRARTIRATPST